MTGYYLVRDADRSAWSESPGAWESDEDSWWVMPSFPAGADVETIKANMPPVLADSSDWVNAYAAGYTLQDAVRWVLGPQGEALTDGEVNAIVDRALFRMTPEEAEDFFGSIGKALKGAAPVLGQIAQTALPIVGGAVGTLVAPGIGTAIGSALGGAAGNLVGQATQRPAAPAPQAVRPAVVRSVVPRSFGPAAPLPLAAPAPAAAGGVNQLLSMINDPQLLAAVANAALGGTGTAPATPGAAPAAFGQVMNQLIGAARGAAAEVHGAYAAETAAAESSGAADAAAHARALVRIVGEATQGRPRT
jgi:hypothetical protein